MSGEQLYGMLVKESREPMGEWHALPKAAQEAFNGVAVKLRLAADGTDPPSSPPGPPEP